jgi:hypothetical protein
MKDDLHSRLEALAARIASTRSELKAKESWHDGHHLTAGEMEARYAYLRKELQGEIADLEAHGHRVTKLELSVRQWIDGLDI